jgi:hypothetical protein
MNQAAALWWAGAVVVVGWSVGGVWESAEAQPAYMTACGYQALDVCGKISMGYSPIARRWEYINDTIESGCIVNGKRSLYDNQ